MKARTSFVANSSSTSFVVTVNVDSEKRCKELIKIIERLIDEGESVSWDGP